MLLLSHLLVNNKKIKKNKKANEVRKKIERAAVRIEPTDPTDP